MKDKDFNSSKALRIGFIYFNLSSLDKRLLKIRMFSFNTFQESSLE